MFVKCVKEHLHYFFATVYTEHTALRSALPSRCQTPRIARHIGKSLFIQASRNILSYLALKSNIGLVPKIDPC